MTYHATFNEYVDREIVPAVSAGEGVGSGFDLEGFARAVGDHETGKGWHLTVDQVEFWRVCAEFDARSGGVSL